MITNPTLPPMAGYVEVEIDGVRLYKNALTGVLLQNEVEPTVTLESISSENETLKAKVTALTTSNQTLEDCLVEMAAIVYA